MRRGDPLQRRTRLRRDGDGARRFANARRKPLRPRSDKRAAQREHEEEISRQVECRDGGCVLRELASHRCVGPNTPHHLRKQSAGGKWTLDNVVCLCAGANTMVEDDPRWGRWIGLVVNREISAAEAWQRRVDSGLVVRTEQP